MWYCAHFSTNVNIIYNCAPKVFFCKIGVIIWSVLCGKFDIVHNLVQMCPLLSIVNIKKYELGEMIRSIFCGKFGIQHDL